MSKLIRARAPHVFVGGVGGLANFKGEGCRSRRGLTINRTGHAVGESSLALLTNSANHVARERNKPVLPLAGSMHTNQMHAPSNHAEYGPASPFNDGDRHIKRGLILQVLLLADHAMARQFCHGEVVGFRFVFEPAFIAEAR